jgi:hypothetical protein
MNIDSQQRRGSTWDARTWVHVGRRLACGVPRRSLGLLAVLVLSLVALADVAVAEEDAVEAGRAALKRTGWYPWYDAEADDVRCIRVEPPRATPAWSGWDLFVHGDWFTPLAWIGIITILGIMVFLLVRAYLSRERSTAHGAVDVAQDQLGDQVDRVEELPVRVQRPASDLLNAAREQYLAGNYSEAIIYLYSHLLLQLDRRNLIHLTKGKTNRQYLREVGRWVSLRGLVESAMVSFEDVFFGERQLERERFESVWNQMDQFDALVEQAAASQGSV